ncbi:MAG TPA: hydantoinase B/oxoprolinase family protein [Dehalococcoidia bacterium]|nr:hydantoinase B/oxoprolinase family protein [Dehalococcoidia bacterium]
MVEVANGPLTLDERIALYGGPAFKEGPGKDPDCLRRPVLEPPTPRELRGMDSVDPVDLEIFAHKLDSIVDEGRAVFMNVGMSEALHSGDVGVGLFTAQGDMAAMSTGVLMHAVLHYGPIKYILKHHRDDPTVGIKDGDIFFFNDPICGGVHPYDMFVTMPIFYQGELIAWAGAGGHQGESGSKDPGGFSATVKTRYEEGLHVTPLKIGENFEIKTDHMDYLAHSVRTPRVLTLDTKARVATCMRVRNRLLREVEKRGADFVAGAMRLTIQRAAQAARERIRHLNDGTYRAVAFLDTVGVEEGLLRVPVTLIKRDDRLVIDVSGASPEAGVGPFHSRWHLIRAGSAMVLLPYVYRGLPWSIGLFDPVDLIDPPSFLNASDEVACGSGSFVGRVVVQALHQAAMKMIFDSEYREGVGSSFAENILLYLVGGKDQWGNPMAGMPMAANAGGQGAKYDSDGEHSAGFWWAMCVDCPGAEEHEDKFPFLYLFRNKFDKNLHGYGKYRGGIGLTEAFMAQNVPFITSSSIGQGDKFSKNFGLFGGYSGPTNPRFIVKNSNVKEMMARTDNTLPYGLYELANEKPVEGDYQFTTSNVASEMNGDRDLLVLVIGSAGGYGDVLERDPHLVVKDLREELITPDVAGRIYRVAYDPETLEPDLDRTAELRAREREDRKRRGRKYDEFAQEWDKKRPKEEILKYYGSWPVPEHP